MRNLLLFCLIPVLFSSCFPVQPAPYLIPESRQKENRYYLPANAQTPMLSKVNDMSFNVNHTLSGDYRSVDFQAAYVVANHVGVSAVFSTKTQSNEVVLPRMEFGAGYILPINKNWLFETYGGAGFGNVKNVHATGSSNFKYSNLFIQPAIAIFNDNKTIGFGLISRLTQANFKFQDTTFSGNRESYSASQIKSLIAQPRHLFWEPGLTLRVGGKQVWFNINYTMSTHLGKNDFDRSKDNFALGATIRFNTRTERIPLRLP